MNIRGACHCGNITFDLDWRAESAEIPARACQCTFCLKHGGVWTSNPVASLRVRIHQATEVSRYLFGTRTAVFHVCRRCGVPPVVTSEIGGQLYAVVNVNTFDEATRGRLRPEPISFDGEDEAERLARRKMRWIADVRLEGG